ncbi:MAG: hypothetical protein DIZ77_02925 [endosymbiont of Seepiophila jonesi]|uniref:Transposase IS801/IS1294 domain-containing protein n=1 Tax=endosymbiont of Lamellibrachia luymesi TaxID=2200907 RepID=A0A370DXL4_9GAMM|nr:MAG: hypothetical protein DIZ79_07510 [endosymbiont of Lamellibrachia luymesi]RDH94083.1 MAG: hypothetical protein DIZ77_02925 [endosymbiont of Seepiophila jonesi]
MVPGGVLTGSGGWKAVRSNYLFPVRALSQRYRWCLVSLLREAYVAGELPRVNGPGEPTITLDRLMQQDWVVYSRSGLSEPKQVLDYLARYTTGPPSATRVCCR